MLNAHRLSQELLYCSLLTIRFVASSSGVDNMSSCEHRQRLYCGRIQLRYIERRDDIFHVDSSGNGENALYQLNSGRLRLMSRHQIVDYSLRSHYTPPFETFGWTLSRLKIPKPSGRAYPETIIQPYLCSVEALKLEIAIWSMQNNKYRYNQRKNTDYSLHLSLRRMLFRRSSI